MVDKDNVAAEILSENYVYDLRKIIAGLLLLQKRWRVQLTEIDRIPEIVNCGHPRSVCAKNQATERIECYCGLRIGFQKKRLGDEQWNEIVRLLQLVNDFYYSSPKVPPLISFLSESVLHFSLHTNELVRLRILTDAKFYFPPCIGSTVAEYLSPGIMEEFQNAENLKIMIAENALHKMALSSTLTEPNIHLIRTGKGPLDCSGLEISWHVFTNEAGEYILTSSECMPGKWNFDNFDHFWNCISLTPRSFPHVATFKVNLYSQEVEPHLQSLAPFATFCQVIRELVRARRRC